MGNVAVLAGSIKRSLERRIVGEQVVIHHPYGVTVGKLEPAGSFIQGGADGMFGIPDQNFWFHYLDVRTIVWMGSAPHITLRG